MKSTWYTPNTTGIAFQATELALIHDGLVVVITPSVSMANIVKQEVDGFLAGRPLDILTFPDWETLPYDILSPHQDIISERIATLSRLPTCRKGLLLLPITTLLSYVIPISYMAAHAFSFTLQAPCNPTRLRQQLEQYGYFSVSQVMQPGEYAIRGSICDLFPMGSMHPLRIDLLGDVIDSLRTFNPETQRSVETLSTFSLLPAREFPLTSEAITRFRAAWRVEFEGDPSLCPIYTDVSDGTPGSGIEYYIPLFFDTMSTLCDYFPANTKIVQFPDLKIQADAFWSEIRTRFVQRSCDKRNPLLPPTHLFLTVDALFGALKAFSSLRIAPFTPQPIPDIRLEEAGPHLLRRLTAFLSPPPARVLFCVESVGRQEALINLLQPFNLQRYPNWKAFQQASTPFGITQASLQHSLWLEKEGIIFIAEADLYGTQVMGRRARQKKQVDPFDAVHHLAELPVGSLVVHMHHGIGRYAGLIQLTLGPVAAEYMILEYQGSDKLYVPVSALHLISRYSQTEQSAIPLNRLGHDQWEKTKRKALEKIHDVAAELLDIYARRQTEVGFAFPFPKEDYSLFQKSFGFEETPDQQTAIDQVIHDLTAPTPMDRLICGDVGFGKTEVALRAAFLVAHAGKQVAVLVPTTLLAQQHVENFQNRFAPWPFRVSVLSRFQSKKEHNDILNKLAQGQIDILIGTHKLLQNNIVFKDLGLLVIDEEHRFGVKQKEKLKSLRAHVDILAMTATPIPRTLHMAMSAIRDFSIIATPPARRLGVKTWIREYDETLIREAILRELMRGGQVYYLHNEVSSINLLADRLVALVPEARVAVAHGQMTERALEKVMQDFYHQRFNVLVCSTIIETGIDIPTANTIIIERADKLGLAQLHQLRGRVGRSHHQAYAYCLTPTHTLMSKDALKRLEALEMHEELGAGFNIASHDLEIRGAGELLGESQSGHIEAIGYSLYMELLENTVAILKTGKKEDWMKPLYSGPEIDMQIPALIPESYIGDIQARLILYKRISGTKSSDELDELQVEMIDRFGLLPEPTQTLFRLTQLKQRLVPLVIQKIELGPEGGFIEFSPDTTVDPKKLISLIQLAPKHYKLRPNRLNITKSLPTFEARWLEITMLLGKL